MPSSTGSFQLRKFSVSGSLAVRVPTAPNTVTAAVSGGESGQVWTKTADDGLTKAVFTSVINSAGAGATATLHVTATDNYTGEVGTASANFAVNAAAAPPATSCLFGVYDPANDYPSSWNGGDGGIQLFAAAPVRIATYYIQWGGAFGTNLANLALAHNAIPYMEMEPWYTSTTWPTFTDIAAGVYDSYLQSFAASIVAYGNPIWLTYAHEMNGSWYPWGNGGPQGVTPAQWLASWEHVHTVINAAAPGLVTWVWAPNNADVGSVVPYYPGDAYVDIAGYDGYLNAAGQTFASQQQITVNEIRSVTTRPIWNAECGIEPADGTRLARIAPFIEGMQQAGLTGFMHWNQSPFNYSTAEIAAVTNAVNAWNASLWPIP
jgi:beta-mannanase